MSTPSLERLGNIACQIALDAEDDTKRRDGQAFTGENVGRALGEVCAQVQALARINAVLIDRLIAIRDGGDPDA